MDINKPKVLKILLYLGSIYYLIGAIAHFFGLTIFTYPTFKLTLPLLLFSLIVFAGIREILKDKLFIIALIILAIFASLSIKETLNGGSEERFSRLNILSDVKLKEELIQKINEERTLSTLPEVVKPLVYNKPLNYGRLLFENYMENLSPEFLFLRGDRNPRHNPGEWGMLYLVELPLILLGLFYLGKKNTKELYLLISWILIVPLATMFLGQTHALRNAFMLPPFLLISSFALTKLSKKMCTFMFILIGIQLVSVLMTIYFYAPNKFGSFWAESAKKNSYLVIENKDKYDKIIVSG